MYEYRNIEEAKPGDVVEWVDVNRHTLHSDHRPPMTLYKLYIATKVTEDFIYVTGDEGIKDPWVKESFRLIKTKPGEMAQVGDTVMMVRQKDPRYYISVKIGMVETVTRIDEIYLVTKGSPGGWKSHDCVVLCKATQTPNEYGNPFKVGDRVRRIAEGNNDCEIGDEHTVIRIAHSAVYYKNTFSSHYKNWELAEEAQPNLCSEIALSTTTKCSQSIPEEETMNLILLLEMMAAMSNEEVTDATNAQHIGILTESNGSYVGYVYANTVEELEDVVRKPSNEGRTLHVFDYSTTLAQKPRKVVAVARTKE